ncbi:MAG: histidinol-phosphate transaminase [Cyanobacteriota bacterium]|nr:histidinol-phosphate transaminase [Cyanobacteriota bacterium]
MLFLRPSLLGITPYDAVIPQSADKLDANEFPLDLPEWFKKKLSLLWEKGIPSNRYPDANHRSLKQAIATYTGVQADQISIGNGSDELIRSLLILTCLEDRGGILVASPTFAMYGILASTLGIPVKTVPRQTSTMAMDLPICQKAMQQESIRMVCVVDPNSPTGNPITAEEWDWIESLPLDVAVLIDEAYFEFVGKTAVTALANHPNWIILRTFSKAFRLATHRVGYAIAHPQVIQALEAIRLPYNLPMFSQWAVQLALEHASELLADLPMIQQEREKLWAALSEIPSVKVWPGVANFLFMQVEGWDPVRLQQQWLAKGTCVRHTGGGIRLTIGTPSENQRTLDNLQEILQVSPQPVRI